MQGILVLMSGFLLHITYGAIYSFGNVTTYLTSYMRLHGFPYLTYPDMMWVQASAMGVTGIFMPLGGSFQHYWGPRVTVTLSSICINSAILLASISIHYSFALVLVTYGIFYGASMSLGYTAPLAAAMRWYPRRRGLVSGIIVSGFGLGTLVFNQIETAFVNPENVSVDETGYITDEKVLSRVPRLFHLLAGIYFTTQLLCSLLLENPPKWNPHETEPLVTSSGTFYPNYSVRDMLRTPRFYALWLTGLFCSSAMLCIVSMYKTFGQQHWTNDALLSTVGSVGSVGSALGRIGWGFVMDRLHYRMSMLLLTCLLTSFLLSLPATPLAGIALYGCWVMLINAMVSGVYVLLPAATAAFFGPVHVAYNYGLITSYYVISGPMTAVLAETILNVVGWDGFFFVVAFFSSIAAVITFFLPPDDVVLPS